MEPPQSTPPCAADAPTGASPPAATGEQPAPPTLQDLAAVPGLGALIMAAVPLPDRVRLRGLCRAFAASVDASLQAQQIISANDLFALDKRARCEGDPLMWLASKCPTLQVLEGQGDPGTLPMQRWWKLPVAVRVVTHLAAHCRELRTLKLHGCQGVSDAGLRAVAANCGELRHLDVGNCWLVRDAGVSAIAAGCRQLEHLNVGHNRKITDDSMVAVAAHCPRLRHLDVQETDIRHAGIVAIAHGCPDLRTLVARYMPIDEDGIVAVAESCPLLERVQSNVGNRGIAAQLLHCARLKELHLPFFAGDHAVRLGPDSCRQLRSLTVSGNTVASDTLAALASHCVELTCLASEGGPAFTDAVVTAFAENCPHLEELYLEGCSEVTDAGMLAVASSCPRLRTVDVLLCRGVTDASLVELAWRCPGLEVVRLSRSGASNRTVLAISQHCRDLRSLDVASRSGESPQARGEALIQDDGLAAVLRNCLRLEVLNLSECEGLSDAGIMLWADSCKRLRKLHLRECRGCFTNRGLAAMAPNLGALEVLNATKCDAVTDFSVVALAAHCPRLKEVNVSTCRVGDEGVTALARHCALVKLDARRCEGLTDVGMVAISEQCGQLVELDVSFCKGVSVTGVTAVASACVWLRRFVVHDSAVTKNDVQALKLACPHVEDFVGPSGNG